MTYALGKLDDRGRMFVKAGDALYEGMVDRHPQRARTTWWSMPRCAPSSSPTSASVGQGRRDQVITPPIQLTLEYAVEFIDDDELVEITPKSVRVRKRHLKEHDRKRAGREAA